MNTYAMAPAENGGFTVQVKQPNGGSVFHRFETEADAVAWVVEKKRVDDAIAHFTRTDFNGPCAGGGTNVGAKHFKNRR